jgi:SAM-dependent methyltransferase
VTGRCEAGYDGGAWAAGPQRVYDRLAETALELLPVELAGTKALDAGAGTGAMTRALLARGARVEATDLSAEMLAELQQQTGGTVPATVADIRSLPMPDASYDVAAAAFVVNQLADPDRAIAELSRVTRPGGEVLVTSFGADQHPVKAAIDEVLRAHGWTPAQWYADAKATTMPLTATVDAFHAVGVAAGLTEFRIEAATVDFADLPPAGVAAYRLGMAHVAGFMSALHPDEHAEILAAATRAAERTRPLALPMLALVARLPP